MSKLISETDFVICDVETTGMSPAAHRMTEICLVKIRDGSIVDSFESLLNPGQYIPPFITKLTGITNSLVQNAPPFASVAEEVAQFLADAVFVAHNASFDWGFVNGEFLRHGETSLDNQSLCTVRLSRRLMPGMASYSLGKLAPALGINIRQHHRARGDCDATVDLFRMLLDRAAEDCEIVECDELFSLQRAPRTARRLPKKAQTLYDQVLAFPETPGVYSFRSSKNQALYIGKAANLRERARTYFQPAAQNSRKVRTLLRHSSSVTFENAETELHALLREAQLIASRQPEFNSALRRKKIFPYLRLGTDNAFPRLEVTTEIHDDGAKYFGPFRTFSSAELALDVVNRLYTLRKCVDNIHPSPDFSPCFYYDIHRCGAPCAGVQSREDYLFEAEKVHHFLSSNPDNIIAQIESVMRECAERLDFEQAAYFRDRLDEFRTVFDKPLRTASSISSENYIFALPEDKNSNRIEFFLVKNGQLRASAVGNAGGSMEKKLERLIAETFSQQTVDEITQAASREMRIVAGWIRQHRNDGVLVAADKAVEPADLARRIIDAIHICTNN